MGTAVDFTLVLLSAAVVLVTANFALKSALALAQRFKMRDELIGMTVLSIGTSLPEIITHVVGSVHILKDPTTLNAVSGLVIGTNVGSDIFQQNFLLAAVALIGVVAVQKQDMLKDVGGLVAAAVILLIFSIGGHINRFEGLLLVALYVAYLFYLRKQGRVDTPEAKVGGNPWAHGLLLLVSFAVMSYAAETMVDHSINLVSLLPISASFFGVLILGIAAAFPELTTALISIYRGRSKISAGVLIGSNITNPMFALGLGAVISGYTVPGVVIWYDLPFKIVTAGLILWFLWDKQMRKKEAILLILLYIGYLIVRSIYFPADVV